MTHPNWPHLTLWGRGELLSMFLTLRLGGEYFGTQKKGNWNNLSYWGFIKMYLETIFMPCILNINSFVSEKKKASMKPDTCWQIRSSQVSADFYLIQFHSWGSTVLNRTFYSIIVLSLTWEPLRRGSSLWIPLVMTTVLWTRWAAWRLASSIFFILYSIKEGSESLSDLPNVIGPIVDLGRAQNLQYDFNETSKLLKMILLVIPIF